MSGEAYNDPISEIIDGVKLSSEENICNSKYNTQYKTMK